jgi:hypothetical protein
LVGHSLTRTEKKKRSKINFSSGRGCRLNGEPWKVFGGGTDRGEPGETEEDADTQYRRILSRVRAVTGVDFSLYRDTTIKRRIMRRMALRTRQSVEQYARQLEHNEPEVRALYHDLLNV